MSERKPVARYVIELDEYPDGSVSVRVCVLPGDLIGIPGMEPKEFIRGEASSLGEAMEAIGGDALRFERAKLLALTA